MPRSSRTVGVLDEAGLLGVHKHHCAAKAKTLRLGTWDHLTAPRKPQPIKSHFPMTDQKGCVVMKVMKPAVAGTLESSDAQVTVEPGVQGNDLGVTVIDGFEGVVKGEPGSVLGQMLLAARAAGVQCFDTVFTGAW